MADGEDKMKDRVIELRRVIRYHRNQVGDDRCWVDDYLVWNSLPETKQVVRLPTYDEGMRKCRLFYQNRNAVSADPMPADAILYPVKWDDDLKEMSAEDLRNEHTKLETAILKHYHIPYERKTIIDDRELYGVLPEKIPADFRLPSEEDFLGTARTDAGCPQFWKSHQNCLGEHNLHQWGPCKK